MVNFKVNAMATVKVKKPSVKITFFKPFSRDNFRTILNFLSKKLQQSSCKKIIKQQRARAVVRYLCDNVEHCANQL